MAKGMRRDHETGRCRGGENAPLPPDATRRSEDRCARPPSCIAYINSVSCDRVKIHSWRPGFLAVLARVLHQSNLYVRPFSSGHPLRPLGSVCPRRRRGSPMITRTHLCGTLGVGTSGCQVSMPCRPPSPTRPRADGPAVRACRWGTRPYGRHPNRHARWCRAVSMMTRK
jgi:hypothetical protein